MWVLTASGEIATGPTSSASSHLFRAWAPDTMSPWTAAPISVPAISMVIPGTEPRAQGDRAGGAQDSAIPHPHPMPVLTVRGGRVPLPRAGGQEHGERRVGHLEELGWPAELRWPSSVQLANQGALLQPNPRARLAYPH